MRIQHYLFYLASALLIANASRAAERSDEVIAPLVGPSTLVIVRADIDRIDENALADQLLATVNDPQLDAPQRDMLRRWWKEWSNVGEGPLSDYREAGVKRIYWVLTLNDFFGNLYLPKTGTWVFPTEDKLDPAKIIDISQRHKLDARRIGELVVARLPGHDLEISRSSALPPEWANALASAGDAPLRIAVVPTVALRKSFEENLPTLPPAAGSVPMTTLTRGIEWVVASVTLSPSPQIRMTLQAPDAAAAHVIAELLDRVLPGVRGKEPKLPPFFLAPPDLAQLLKPMVAGSQLRWEPDFQRVIAPVIARDIRQGVRQHSAANMRQILQGLIMYDNNHKGQTPPDLDALIKDQEMSRQVLIDPLNPGEKSGYVYVRPAGDWQKPDLLVIYESTPNGQNIGYGDGHVEWWPTHPQVLEQARAAEVRNRAAEQKK